MYERDRELFEDLRKQLPEFDKNSDWLFRSNQMAAWPQTKEAWETDDCYGKKNGAVESLHQAHLDL